MATRGDTPTPTPRLWPFARVEWLPAAAGLAVGLLLGALLLGRFDFLGRSPAVSSARPQLLYVGWDETGQNRLFAVDPAGGEPLPLSHDDHDVTGYALHPAGEVIVYASARPGGGSDLWHIDVGGGRWRRVLACPDAACTGPVWHPAGERLVYERGPANGNPAGETALWWLDVDGGETTPVFPAGGQPGLGARFSYDGQWLSFNVPSRQEIAVYNLESDDLLLLPSQSGDLTAWSPTANLLLFTDIAYRGERFSVPLYRLDVDEQQVVDLSGEIETNDGAPSWSPDGAWIAFGRKVPRTPLGRQIWRMRPDGSAQTPLTSAPAFQHGRAVWSPDGTTLAFSRFPVADGGAPGIWLLDPATGEMRAITTPGRQPTWLP